jgi:hypothetical protein
LLYPITTKVGWSKCDVTTHYSEYPLKFMMLDASACLDFCLNLELDDHNYGWAISYMFCIIVHQLTENVRCRIMDYVCVTI